MLSTTPICGLLIAKLQGESISAKAVIGSVIAVAGVFLILFGKI